MLSRKEDQFAGVKSRYYAGAVYFSKILILERLNGNTLPSYKTNYIPSLASFRFVVIIIKIFGIWLLWDVSIKEVHEEGNKD